MDNQKQFIYVRNEKMGRKFLLSIISMFLIAVGLFASPHAKVIESLYATFVGGILGCLSAFSVGNVAATHVATKNLKKEEPEV